MIWIHEAVPHAAKLGGTYVPAQLVGALTEEHATWTHGQLIQRRLPGNRPGRASPREFRSMLSPRGG